MNRILTDFISLFYPRTCIGCNRTLISKEEYLCLSCKLNLPTTEFHADTSNPIKKRLPTIHNLHTVFAYLKFGRRGIAQKLLHQVKYNGQEKLAVAMGEWFGYHIKKTTDTLHIDMIVPIPLHQAKLNRRGYNQSELIANGLGDTLGIPVESNIIKRKKDTATQTKKSKTDRWLNVDSIFEQNGNGAADQKHILLIDDVITTGATIESAAAILNEGGASHISVACIATGQQ